MPQCSRISPACRCRQCVLRAEGPKCGGGWNMSTRVVRMNSWIDSWMNVPVVIFVSDSSTHFG
jgi:hypothetical protein